MTGVTQFSPYFSIEIRKNGYALVEGIEPVSKRIQLESIKEVMQRRLPYAGKAPNRRWDLLWSRTQWVRKTFRSKPTLSSKHADRIEQLYRCIEKIYRTTGSVTSVFPLPHEIKKYFFTRYLSLQDLKRLSQVNKDSLAYAQEGYIKKAQEYGYQGYSYTEAHGYLKTFAFVLCTLVKYGYICSKFVVYQDPSHASIDIEASLLSLKSPRSENEAEHLRRQLNEALLHYVWSSQFVFVRFLLWYGADPNAHQSNYSGTALHLAASMGNVEMVGTLLDAGADPNAESANKFGPSRPLHKAAWNGSASCVRLLLTRGANLEIKSNGITALGYALKRLHNWDFGTYRTEAERKETVKVLLERIVNVANPQVNRLKAADSDLLLHWMIGRRYLNLAELLLQSGADPNLPNERGNRPLHIAALHGSVEGIALLHKYGADLNLVDRHDHLPLHVAAKKGHNNVVKFFLSKGVYAEFNTALSLALQSLEAWRRGLTSESRKKETVMVLLKKILETDQSVHLSAPDGTSLFEWAIKRGYTEIAELVHKNN